MLTLYTNIYIFLLLTKTSRTFDEDENIKYSLLLQNGLLPPPEVVEYYVMETMMEINEVKDDTFLIHLYNRFGLDEVFIANEKHIIRKPTRLIIVFCIMCLVSIVFTLMLFSTIT